jgi:signal transduction histidine kinase
VFDRFFRSERATNRQIQGTGLGLFIARAITDAHGGKIGVTSTVGEGTTFRIELPTQASTLDKAEAELVA